MNIQSATKKAAEIGGVIHRRSWDQCVGDPVVIIPGYGPECCQMAHLTADGLKDKAPRWQPQQDDLVADDWLAVKDYADLPPCSPPESRRPFNPERGEIYENRGGGTFLCLAGSQTAGRATLWNTASGWTFVAHNCGIYPDGTIDWDFSSGGRFGPLEPEDAGEVRK